MISFDNPRFLATPCTRCLICQGTDLKTREDVLNYDIDDEEDPEVVDFWRCRDCAADVAIGLGAKNEVNGAIEWMQEYPDAATEGTVGVRQVTPIPPRYEMGRTPNGLEIWSLETDFSFERSLREAVDEPVQVEQEASALALALLFLETAFGEIVSEKAVLFNNQSLSIGQLRRKLEREIEPSTTAAMMDTNAIEHSDDPFNAITYDVDFDDDAEWRESIMQKVYERMQRQREAENQRTNDEQPLQ